MSYEGRNELQDIEIQANTIFKELEGLRAWTPDTITSRGSHLNELESFRNTLNGLLAKAHEHLGTIKRTEYGISLMPKGAGYVTRVKEVAAYRTNCSSAIVAIETAFASLKQRKRVISNDQSVSIRSGGRDTLVELANYRDELREFSADRTRIESMRIMSVEIAQRLDGIIKKGWLPEFGERI